jgi:threonine aldolase
MESVDLRSDTVSHPTPAMREAMALAPVGDDVYGEDPTINRLQEMAAQRMGMEAALFVASGTMGNLVAVLSHCRRGDEVILGKQAHIFLHEAGGISALGGVHSSQIPNQADGTLAPQDVLDSIREDDAHEPVTRLVTLENTHNACGGVPLTPEYTHTIGELAHAQSLKLHIDGARIFNASVAQGVDVRKLVEPADSVTFCLSKGLCAPVGSILCGSSEFIARAHRIRKLLGGGMRQAGVLAAAGIVALDTMVDRLSEDHARARALAAGLNQIPGVVLDPGSPFTNMVFLSIEKGSAFQVCQNLMEYGIKVVPINARRFRLVTHYWVDDLGIERTLDTFRKVLSAVS